MTERICRATIRTEVGKEIRVPAQSLEIAVTDGVRDRVNVEDVQDRAAESVDADEGVTVRIGAAEAEIETVTVGIMDGKIVRTKRIRGRRWIGIEAAMTAIQIIIRPAWPTMRMRR